MVTNKKIILICYGKANPYNMNGVSRSVHNVAENLYYKKINFEVWGITPTPEIKTFKRKYNIFLFKKNNFNLISSDLKKKIKSLETKTIVHFFGAMSIEFFLISRLLKKKIYPG